MRVMLAGEAATPGAHNFDWAGATADGTAVVLDGLTEHGPTGCVHGTAWFVRQLGGRLLARAGDRTGTLAEALAATIGEVAALHASSCDLGHPGTPSATVAVLREGAEGDLEYLVLSDAVAAFDVGTEPVVVTDRGVPPAVDGIQAQQLLRNRPDGSYWVAQHNPAAVRYALTGRVANATGAVLLSDGAAAAVQDYAAMTWRELFDIAYERGPGDVISAVRELERSDANRTVWPRFKVHDDATLVVVRP
jgi:hypothetical protein